ncbi:hypothetical protein ZOSMA_18G00260 [Zostera marina]|uniref:Uncharacterized protein n=1 Tax=Zostera marina TaxID=29655 RepID=A0A0K9PPP0_ZOSMR|nr:hypothetical protein ZOSMA_18G00260 [Zostera marina]
MSGQCYVSPHLSSSSSFFFSAFSPSSRQLQHIYTRPQNPRNLSNAQFLTSISDSSLPRRRRRSHLTPPTNTTTTTYVDFSDKPRSVATSTFVNPSNLELSFDVDRVASYLKRYCNDFLSSGEDAFHDLRSSVRVRDEYGRRGIVFSCRKSSVLFVGNVLIYCSVGFLLYRVFGGVLSWFRLQWGHGNWSSSVVTKMDRSLGGKEVVVARKSNNTVFRNMENDSRKTSPLSLGRLDGMQTRIGSDSVKYKSRKERIPEWWPVSVPSSSSSSEVNDGSSQREASMLVRGQFFFANWSFHT